MKIISKFWIAASLILGLVVISLAASTSVPFGDTQTVVTKTSGGVTIDFSANPIEEVYLYSSWEGGTLEENISLKKKKVVAVSCAGDGACIIGSVSYTYRLEAVFFDDNTSIVFI